MKKLVFLFAVVCSVSMFSCKSADKNAAEATDATEVVEAALIEEIATPSDSAATDTVATDSVAALAAAVAE